MTSKFCDLAPSPLPPSWGSTLLGHAGPAGWGLLNGASSTTTLSETQSSGGNGRAKKALHPHFLPSTDLSGLLPLVNRASPLREPAHIGLLFEHRLPRGPWCGPLCSPANKIRILFPVLLCLKTEHTLFRRPNSVWQSYRSLSLTWISLAPAKMADWRSNSRQLGPLL